MHRLFVALRPPHAVRHLLNKAMGGVAGARWQDDAQLHVTLRYIGKVERHVAEDIAIALRDVRSPALTVAVRGVGTFETRGRIDTLWAGVGPADAITRLHRKIDHALVRVGLAPEGRAYQPHITIARFGRDAGPVDRFLADWAMMASDPFTIDHFRLFESHVGQGGATYDTIARYPLIQD